MCLMPRAGDSFRPNDLTSCIHSHCEHRALRGCTWHALYSQWLCPQEPRSLGLNESPAMCLGDCIMSNVLRWLCEADHVDCDLLIETHVFLVFEQPDVLPGFLLS